MKAKTVKEVLIAAKWIIENVGWCQGAARRDAQGKEVYLARYNDPKLRDVVAFCALGAIDIVDVDDHQLRMKAMSACRKQTAYHVSIPYWNDKAWRTKQEVIDMFSKAIESEG